MLPKSVPEPSRERLESVSGCPRDVPGAPGGSQRAPRVARKSARTCPGARRGGQSRRQIPSGSEKIAFLPRDALVNRFRDVFATIFVDFRCDFHRFSKSLRASKSTRSANGRTLDFAGRRGTFEGSRILRANGKSTKHVEKIASRSQSSRSRDATSKNH